MLQENSAGNQWRTQAEGGGGGWREQNGRHLADVIFKCIFMNDSYWILIKISLKFVPKGSVDNK